MLFWLLWWTGIFAEELFSLIENLHEQIKLNPNDSTLTQLCFDLMEQTNDGILKVESFLNKNEDLGDFETCRVGLGFYKRNLSNYYSTLNSMVNIG